VKAVILSRRRTLYTTRRLAEECRRAGICARVLDPFKCVLAVRHERPAILYGGRALKGVDLVIPRVGTFGAAYALAVLRQFDLLGVPCFNGPAAIARARDKLGCLQILARRGVPIPDTLIAHGPRRMDELIRELGGAPLILKLLSGTQGAGVAYADSAAAAASFVEALWALGQDVLMQKFIEESRGIDRRLIVCRGEVVAAMQRMARPGEFRSNIHRGGMGVEIQPSRQEQRLAIRAVRGVGLQWAGVDMLVSASGPKIIEVNASAGLWGIEAATQQNVARRVVEAARLFARRPAEAEEA
jgi:ribosomal protein S6--L-glutamate ligase